MAREVQCGRSRDLVGPYLYQRADLPGLASAPGLSRPVGHRPLPVTLRTGAEHDRVAADDARMVLGHHGLGRIVCAGLRVETVTHGSATPYSGSEPLGRADHPLRRRGVFREQVAFLAAALATAGFDRFPVPAATPGAPDGQAAPRPDFLAAPGRNGLRLPASLDCGYMDQGQSTDRGAAGIAGAHPV